MSRNSDVYAIPSVRITIAPTSCVKIGPGPYQLATSIKLISGGTLEIGGAPGSSIGYGFTALIGTGVGTTGQTFGQMYPLSANEVFSANTSGEFYLWAHGATCVVSIAMGKSAGFGE
jgi:hypothetical protein